MLKFLFYNITTFNSSQIFFVILLDLLHVFNTNIDSVFSMSWTFYGDWIFLWLIVGDVVDVVNVVNVGVATGFDEFVATEKNY